MLTGDSAGELLAAGAEALVEAAFRTGEYAGAEALLRAALVQQRGDPRRIPGGTLALGQAQLVAGNGAQAVRLLRAAVRQSREAGLRQRRIEQAEDWLRRAESGEVPDLR